MFTSCLKNVLLYNAMITTMLQVSADNETDLYCLHFVFLPRINSSLDSFIESWNNHRISTENNMTPNQLYIKGALEQNMTPRMPQNMQQPFSSSSTVSLPRASSRVEVTLVHVLHRVPE